MTDRPGGFCTLVVAAIVGSSAPAVALDQGPATEALTRGSVELSTAVALTVRQAADDGENSLTTLDLPIRAGLMVTDRIEVEAEALVTHVSYRAPYLDDRTDLTGAVHLVYHLGLGRSTAPYLLAGVGYASRIEPAGLAAQTYGFDTGAPVLRAGAGVKAFFSPRASLRAEYRFTRFQGGEQQGGDVTSSANVNDHKVLVGLSVWF